MRVVSVLVALMATAGTKVRAVINEVTLGAADFPSVWHCCRRKVEVPAENQT